MPLYTFDPAEEAGDWDCDLLEADRDQQMVLRRVSTIISFTIFISRSYYNDMTVNVFVFICGVVV